MSASRWRAGERRTREIAGRVAYGVDAPNSRGRTRLHSAASIHHRLELPSVSVSSVSSVSVLHACRRRKYQRRACVHPEVAGACIDRPDSRRAEPRRVLRIARRARARGAVASTCVDLVDPWLTGPMSYGSLRLAVLAIDATRRPGPVLDLLSILGPSPPFQLPYCRPCRECQY